MCQSTLVAWQPFPAQHYPLTFPVIMHCDNIGVYLSQGNSVDIVHIIIHITM